MSNAENGGLLGKLQRVFYRARHNIGAAFFVTGIFLIAEEAVARLPEAGAWRMGFAAMMVLIGLYSLGMRRELHAIGDAADTVVEAASEVGKTAKKAGKKIKKIGKD